MTGPWKSLGRILTPDPGAARWWRTHAALPAAMPTRGNGVRVLFSGRDSQNRAHVGAFTWDPGDIASARGLTTAPLLAPGDLGAFDDAGVTVSCVIDVEGDLYLYYTGWTLGGTVPFHLAVGLAVSSDGGETFERVSRAPIMGRHRVDPFLIASPSVVRESRGDFRAWYVSATGWERDSGGHAQHRYHIRHATSTDGIDWRRDGHVSVDFGSPEEYALGRPHVVRRAEGYEMYFCQRGTAYRLAYARSADGLNWERDDRQARIEGDPAAWESEMRAYPWHLRHGGEEFLLYNGNDYGRTGVGVAVRVDP